MDEVGIDGHSQQQHGQLQQGVETKKHGARHHGDHAAQHKHLKKTRKRYFNSKNPSLVFLEIRMVTSGYEQTVSEREAAFVFSISLATSVSVRMHHSYMHTKNTESK